jgi:hypothetical protein
MLLLVTLSALVLLSLALNLFVARQWRSVGNQLRDQRSVLQRVSTEYRTLKEPRMKGFLAQLHRFAATNKDFQPLLDKYRPLLEAHYPPTLTPAITPAPGAGSMAPVAPK